MNAIELLKADHARVNSLFKKVEASGKGEHKAIFEKIKAELETHAHVEEAIFYPTLQATGNDKLVELTSEAVKEHVQMKTFLGELAVADAKTDDFEALLAKLIEDVRHHVEEEEGEMFPTVEKHFDADAIDLLGEQMKAEKEKFRASADTAYN